MVPGLVPFLHALWALVWLAPPDDKLWNLAGHWMFDRAGAAVQVISLRVQGDGTVGVNLYAANLGRSSAIAEATRKDGKLHLVGYANYEAYKAKRSAWRADLAEPLTLQRWKADGIRISPAEAVRLARARWEQDGRKMDDAGVSVSEMADEEVIGRPGKREWWVHIPQGLGNVRPAALTIAVDARTGAVRGPFGR